MAYDTESSVYNPKKPSSRGIYSKFGLLAGILIISLIVTCMVMIVRHNSKYLQSIMFDESTILRKLVEEPNEKSLPSELKPMRMETDYLETPAVEQKYISIKFSREDAQYEDSVDSDPTVVPESCQPTRRFLVVEVPCIVDDLVSNWCSSMIDEESTTERITTFCEEISSNGVFQIDINDDNVTITDLNRLYNSESFIQSDDCITSKRVQIEEFPCEYGKLTCEQLRSGYDQYRVFCEILEPNSKTTWITDGRNTYNADFLI